MKLKHEITDLAESVIRLASRAAAEYAPIVEEIVRDRSRDVALIERTLDGLLDFGFDAEALLLYKRLCRYYFFIDPGASGDYVRFYLELWEAEPGADLHGSGDGP